MLNFNKSAKWKTNFYHYENFLQVILPLLKNDFYEVIQATIDGKLCSFMPAWSENSTAVCVVMASPGYPGDCDKGMEVTGNCSRLFAI